MNNKRFSIILGAVLLAAVVLFLAFKVFIPSNAKAVTNTNSSYLSLRQSEEFLHAGNAVALPNVDLNLRQSEEFLHAANAAALPSRDPASSSNSSLGKTWGYERSMYNSATAPQGGMQAIIDNYLRLRQEWEYVRSENH